MKPIIHTATLWCQILPIGMWMNYKLVEDVAGHPAVDQVESPLRARIESIDLAVWILLCAINQHPHKSSCQVVVPMVDQNLINFILTNQFKEKTLIRTN